LFQAEDGIRDFHVTGVQTCALPICASYAAKLSAEEAARIATAQLREDLAAAHTSCAGLIRLIKAFADSTDAPAAIYNLAQIPLRSEERRVGKARRARESA